MDSIDSICWLAVFIVLLVIEIFTLGLTTIWFCIGAIAAFIASFMDAGCILQAVLFVSVSLVSLLVTRPIAVKYLMKDQTPTNVDEMIGKMAVITKGMSDADDMGEAVLNGDTWMTCPVDGRLLETGDHVKVVKIEGVKLIVEKIQKG